MIVDDGDTSQWKRSGIERAAIGPASAWPAATDSTAARWARTTSASQSGDIADIRLASSATRAPRKRFGRHISTIPALNPSPRSTRGTTRMIAYSNGARPFAASGRASTVGLLDERARCLQAREQVVDVGAAVGVGVREAGLRREPVVRDGGGQPLEERAVDEGRQTLVRLGDGPG